jgi:hypothetical protein
VAALEATTLPVSNKPVTLSFNKGGLSLNKSAGKSSRTLPNFYNIDFCAGAVKPGISSAFGAGDGADEDEDDPSVTADAKGLSPARRYQRDCPTAALTTCAVQWPLHVVWPR